MAGSIQGGRPARPAQAPQAGVQVAWGWPHPMLHAWQGDEISATGCGTPCLGPRREAGLGVWVWVCPAAGRGGGAHREGGSLALSGAQATLSVKDCGLLRHCHCRDPACVHEGGGGGWRRGPTQLYDSGSLRFGHAHILTQFHTSERVRVEPCDLPVGAFVAAGGAAATMAIDVGAPQG